MAIPPIFVLHGISARGLWISDKLFRQISDLRRNLRRKSARHVLPLALTSLSSLPFAAIVSEFQRHAVEHKYDRKVYWKLAQLHRLSSFLGCVGPLGAALQTCTIVVRLFCYSLLLCFPILTL